MDTWQDFVITLIFLGAVQGGFLALVLWRHPSNGKQPNRLLAGLLLICALCTSGYVYCQTAAVAAFPHVLEIYFPFAFLCGPLFWYYVRALTTVHFRLDRTALWHGLPAVLVLLYLLPFYVQEGQAKLEALWAGTTYVHWQALTVLLLAHLLIYFVLALRRLRRHGVAIKQTFANIEQINLRWLWSLTVIFLLVWGALLVITILPGSGGALDFVVPLLLSVVIYTMGYRGLRQPAVFTTPFAEADEGSPSGAHTADKYATSTLTVEQAEATLRRLLDLFETEKPFLDDGLSLPALARQLSISTHHLSQVINERGRQNFFDFVNSYRVEEAKTRLGDPRFNHLTVEAIAQEVGFRSRSAFYAAFKQHTGKTPTQFKKHLSAAA